MRRVIAITQVTLDGVMQSPGGPEEDPRNGFTHGGWVMPFWDDALNQAIGETIAGEFDMLLGRRTYEIFAAYWPNQGIQQGDEVRRHAHPRPVRLGELAAHRR
jgi:dihydrofolate reductase